ncbi:hypothetical protein V2J56_08155 [Georgenia sp. MJ206]|uniref:hypothetical protein n=1 Tax=Georgenia wangjunii TaxID=3117730 RepID=UPI002F2606CE
MTEVYELSTERVLDRGGRRIKVMVLVKAAPQPSRTYGDTVCVAGVAVSPGSARWVRLYPVPFRYMAGDKQFRKYDIIDVKVRDASADKRVESLRIDAQSLEIERHVGGWERRAQWVEPLQGLSMCGVLRAVRADMNSVSLAAIRPTEVYDLLIEEHAGWSTSELKRFEQYAQQGDLFAETPPTLLKAPHFRARLKYRCESPDCPTHTQRVIDWELNALQYYQRALPDVKLRASIREKFFDQMYGASKRPLIFVGNQENPQRRQSFTVLGTYYPKAGQTPGDNVLF